MLLSSNGARWIGAKNAAGNLCHECPLDDLDEWILSPVLTKILTMRNGLQQCRALVVIPGRRSAIIRLRIDRMAVIDGDGDLIDAGSEHLAEALYGT